MSMEPRSNGRLVLTLAVLSILAVLVWKTMEPGKFQYLAWILLGFFAFRVVIMSLSARYSKDEGAKGHDSGSKAEQEG
jgi:hypothetical protein